VIAKTDNRAKELASAQFRKEATSTSIGGQTYTLYPERYWTNLEATLMCDDTTKEFASEVSD
jgi:hypothetical protein